jgi:hypothetical protein
VVYFIQVSSPKPCIRFSSPPYALHAPPISFFLILSPEQYKARIILNTIRYNIKMYVTGIWYKTVNWLRIDWDETYFWLLIKRQVLRRWRTSSSEKKD